MKKTFYDRELKPKPKPNYPFAEIKFWIEVVTPLKMKTLLDKKK